MCRIKWVITDNYMYVGINVKHLDKKGSFPLYYIFLNYYCMYGELCRESKLRSHTISLYIIFCQRTLIN